MTATNTPGREEMLAWAAEVQSMIDAGDFPPAEMRKATAIADLLRLAAKPADEWVRAKTIEECAKVAEAHASDTADGEGEIFIARKIADQIRKLSPVAGAVDYSTFGRKHSDETKKRIGETQKRKRALSTTGEPKP